MDNFVIDETLRIPIISKGLSIMGFFPNISDNKTDYYYKNLKYTYI